MVITSTIGAIEINAFQSHSDVVIQQSTREGFGLTVTEAIWKARPFIGGDVGRDPAAGFQETGYLVSSVEESRERALRDPAGPRSSAQRLGRAGKEPARRHFLMPRLLRDWLELFE